jgi:hypothetical protein
MDRARGSGLRTVAVVARVTLLRPRLWTTAVRTAVAVTPTRWWRRRPFLPLPTAGYLRLRAVTQYGDPGAVPTGEDVARYLVWCRDMRRHG